MGRARGRWRSEPAACLAARLCKRALPSLGTLKPFPSACRFAPKTLQGLEAPSARGSERRQGGRGARARRLRAVAPFPSRVNSLFSSSVEQAQIKIGSSAPLFPTSYERRGCLVASAWAKGLWEPLSERGGRVPKLGGSSSQKSFTFCFFHTF